jgi:hypothetical protein
MIARARIIANSMAHSNHELISQIAKVEGPEWISQASPKVEVVEGVSLNDGL